VANTFVFLATMASIAHWRTPPGHLSHFVASKASVFTDGEYWRLLTALGGHGDFMHFAHNMPILWFFAWLLKGYFGFLIALVGALLVGIAANAVTVFTYKENVQLLGASGMVYGMVAMWLVLYIRFDHKGWWVKRAMRSLGFALLVLFPQTYEANVSYTAHGAGFLIGGLVGLSFMGYASKYAPVFTEHYYLPQGAS
jgi:membrane associated rhomboid family serine protease